MWFTLTDLNRNSVDVLYLVYLVLVVRSSGEIEKR